MVRGVVDNPTRRPDRPREIIVSEIVTAEPSCKSVVLPIAKPAGFAVIVWPATAKVDGVAALDSALDGIRSAMEVPICESEGPKDITVPESVIAGPPGRIVVPLIPKPEEFAVKL